MSSRLATLPGGLLIAALACGAAIADDLSAELQLGREIYTTKCASCHGKNAEGAPDWQKPDQLGELPAPPHDATGHTWRHSDQELFEMIAEGWRDPFNTTDRLTMPAFGDDMTTEEIDAVIAYLKTLWTADQRQSQQDKTAETSSTPMN